jgi:hypothetical protein
LSCRGIAGDTGWRDGYGRPLRQRERLEETLEADLVIDASGRGALTLALLKIDRPTAAGGEPRSESTWATPRASSPFPTMPRRIGKAS